MKLTMAKALAQLVDAHDDQQLTSEQWDNARGLIAYNIVPARTPRCQFEILVKRFGPMDKGTLSKCYIAIYDGQNEMRNCAIVIAEQILDGNAGVSITNAAESFATEVSQYFNIAPNKLVWIEHYPQRGTSRAPSDSQRETFDRVVFDASVTKLIRPQWNHIDRETVEYWIGGKLS